MTSMEKGCREDTQGAKVRRILLLSSPRRRGSSGICGAPVWIPARRCAPSEMTSREGRTGGDDVLFLMSSWGRRRRNPGSSDWAVTAWLAGRSNGRRMHLRGTRLDPGSVLRAVRDDVSEGTCRPGDVNGEGVPGGHSGGKSAPHSFAVIPAEAGIQWHLRGTRLDPGSALRAVRDDVSEGAYRPG